MTEQRRNLKEWLFWIMIVACLLLLIYNTQRTGHRGQMPEVQVANGIKVSEFHLKRTSGEEFSPAMSGQTLVAFLSTECGPCQKQVNSLNEASKSGKYTQVIGVFFEPNERVSEFESNFRPEFLCVVDQDKIIEKQLHLTVFPQTVKATNGIVVKGWVGLQTRFD